jgi:hypothetical protein
MSVTASLAWRAARRLVPQGMIDVGLEDSALRALQQSLV